MQDNASYLAKSTLADDLDSPEVSEPDFCSLQTQMLGFHLAILPDLSLLIVRTMDLGQPRFQLDASVRTGSDSNLGSWVV